MHRLMKASSVVLSLACLSQTVAAQEAAICVAEAEKLSAAFSLDDPDRQDRAVIAGTPGTRIGAGMTGQQRNELSGMVDDARAAGQRGESAVCERKLNAARALLREAGVGSATPGSASPGAAALPADRSPNLEGTQAPPEVRDTLRDGAITSPAERIPGPGISGGAGGPETGGRGGIR